jgi:peptidoglycan/xylan/chitin deacetylase (PgdA/CDA1 family)
MKWKVTPGAVLCLHGVAETGKTSRGGTHVEAKELRSLLRTVRALGEVVPLTTLVQRTLEGRSTAGLVALTFDDAYHSLELVVDELGRDGIPFTVFVASEAAEAGGRYWWDRIDDMFARVPPEEWRLFENRCGLPERFRRGQPAALGPLRPMRQWILSEFRGRLPAQVEAPLSELEERFGGSTLQRSMTFAEIRALRRRAPFDVGVHTATHAVLPLLSRDEIEAEIQQCARRLHAEFSDALDVLAIPYGLADDRTVATAREAGMTASCTTEARTLHGVAPGAGLPRFCVTAGQPPWKVFLRLAGVTERLKGGRSATPRYPPLPSETT